MVRGVSVHRASSDGKGADIGCSVGETTNNKMGQYILLCTYKRV